MLSPLAGRKDESAAKTPPVRKPRAAHEHTRAQREGERRERDNLLSWPVPAPAVLW